MRNVNFVTDAIGKANTVSKFSQLFKIPFAFVFGHVYICLCTKAPHERYVRLSSNYDFKRRLIWIFARARVQKVANIVRCVESLNL